MGVGYHKNCGGPVCDYKKGKHTYRRCSSCMAHNVPLDDITAEKPKKARIRIKDASHFNPTHYKNHSKIGRR